MEYLGFWVTRESVRPAAKINISHSIYDSSKEYKGSLYIYHNDKLLKGHVGHKVTQAPIIN